MVSSCELSFVIQNWNHYSTFERNQDLTAKEKCILCCRWMVIQQWMTKRDDAWKVFAHISTNVPISCVQLWNGEQEQTHLPFIQIMCVSIGTLPSPTACLQWTWCLHVFMYDTKCTFRNCNKCKRFSIQFGYNSARLFMRRCRQPLWYIHHHYVPLHYYKGFF